jgi:hypothetical protein
MCFFEQDDDETADKFWREDQQQGSDDCAFYAYEQSCDPDSHDQLIFDVAMTSQQLILASALIGMLKRRKDIYAVIDAAWSLKEFLGTKPVPQSAESRQWNERHEVGTVVQYYPNGRNGDETYLGRTSSPAIDTQSGPVVLIEGHKSAVSLLDVTPRKTTSPEVLP